jgi:hypothetical protein
MKLKYQSKRQKNHPLRLLILVAAFFFLLKNVDSHSPNQLGRGQSSQVNLNYNEKKQSDLNAEASIENKLNSDGQKGIEEEYQKAISSSSK